MEIPLINHRLFTNNRSTYTHWYPGNNRGPIAIKDLTYPHLAAIIDQYQTEAAKLLANLTGRHVAPTSLRVHGFLSKHVKAWDAIKKREDQIKQFQPAAYRKLFVDKGYEKVAKDKIIGYTDLLSFIDELSRPISISIPPYKPQIPKFDGRGPISEVVAKQEAANKERAANKEKAILRALNLKIEIDNLMDFIKKNL